jgi:putative hydrolase of the HAD superfamily
VGASNGHGAEQDAAPGRAAIRAVLFDLDDTLFDNQFCSRAGLAAIQAGFPTLASEPFHVFEQRYRVLLEEVHLKVLSGQLSPAAARAERFQRFLSAASLASIEDAERAAVLYATAFRASRRPIAGALELLGHLKAHVRIGVVTNNVRHEQVEKLQHCQLDGLIDVLVTSEDVGVAKPHPAIFEAALQQLACTPDQVVMVGDNWENDIVGATRVGMRSIWLNRYAEPHLDTTLAPEITGLTPLEAVVALLMGEVRSYDAARGS